MVAVITRQHPLRAKAAHQSRAAKASDTGSWTLHRIQWQKFDSDSQGTPASTPTVVTNRPALDGVGQQYLGALREASAVDSGKRSEPTRFPVEHPGWSGPRRTESCEAGFRDAGLTHTTRRRRTWRTADVDTKNRLI